MPIVFVGCTSRKRKTPSRLMRARELPVQSMKELSTLWLARLGNERERRPAREAYCGRSFSQGLAAATMLKAPLYIISAGLGCVRSEVPIPAYSLTVASGPDNILMRAKDGVGPSDWWRLIVNASPFSTEISSAVKSGKNGLILLALSGPYVKMIESDLLALSAKTRARLRIFTACPPSFVAEQLRPFVMPYDRRLDGPDSPAPGTVSDFSARAMADFALQIALRLPFENAQRHAAAVRYRQRHWRLPKAIRRVRKSEQELLALVEKHRAAANGVPSRLLKILRHDLGVACEQSRVKHLLAKLEA